MGEPPEVRVFCHPVDLVDDLDATLDDIAGVVPRGCQGPAGVALAAAYHSSRDYLPRNHRRVHYSPAGVAFQPERSRYPAQIPPLPQMPVSAGRDMLLEAADAGRAKGLAVDAWVVYLHHDEAEPASMEGRAVNAFGDTYPVALCPSSPVVAEYAEALTRDIAARRPASIVAEALHHQPFSHGFHHERMFGGHGGLRRFLLGLCFCPDCRSTARDQGLDVHGVATWVRVAVDDAVGQQPLPDRDVLDSLAAPHIGVDALLSYLRLRTQHTTAIVARCATAARQEGVNFTWLDAAHALADLDSEAGTSHPGWQIGCDPGAVGETCGVATACYAATQDAAAQQLAQITNALARPPEGAIMQVLGSTYEELQEQHRRLSFLAGSGVGWIGLYHFGLAPVPLDVAFNAPPSHSHLE